MALALTSVVARLEPDCLGVYWPVRSEFNAARLWLDDKQRTALPLALPFAQRQPPQMHYRRWRGEPLVARDECGMAVPEGESAIPDVVLVPCVGYTRTGFRLGYGGGFFDRWLAAHPHVTSVGVAWSACEIDDADLAPQPHDQPLTLVVTEYGVVA